MKRTVIVFISLLFILSACGGKESKENKENTTASTIAESEVAAFVGEGQMTVLRTLINSNEFFVNDVYVASHLPVDKSAAVNNANGTFAPVISDKIKTYSDLSDMLKATYTAKTAEKILSEQKYLEIDGKLYESMTNIGTNPTVNGSKRTVETNIFDFDGILYGKYIKSYFFDFIRPRTH